jgi:cellulose synthase/poly-beta-1,6-N-acetylglucosamine synthase-like glycosyltransferase
VALVDSDYQAEPDFLAALVGHFDDPTIGFVQTPHDYRDWDGSLYQRLCYHEYRP